MLLSDFTIEIPEELIADYPLANRNDSRMLVVDPQSGELLDKSFSNFIDYLSAGDVLVLNNTKVIPARLKGRKETGGQLELLLERVASPTIAWCHLRSSNTPRVGSNLIIGGKYLAKVVSRDRHLFEIELLQSDFDAVMESEGHIPLPPYIKRTAGSVDLERYQTVYANTPGAVAAPTAGLHFTKALLQALSAKGVQLAEITLHVGAGTFQPVRVESLAKHYMHQEWLEVSESTVDKIERCQQQGGAVVAVGTTVVRALESAARSGALEPYRGTTDLFILPGFKWQVVDRLLTNFHLSKSTLLMLTCAFGSKERIFQAYHHAIKQRYRFFSYGDAMLIKERAA